MALPNLHIAHRVKVVFATIPLTDLWQPVGSGCGVKFFLQSG
jgi:hypothetical protein